jgi:hypothetical protein
MAGEKAEQSAVERVGVTADTWEQRQVDSKVALSELW